ncbi:hypothetical protein RNAN_2476 [Rheinheimera nanhaiensis E407-8]|uniref:Uncharacterized protein n=1 Tax=Rheinheimera nanhaiensis E407-8 TaxID=562729 RepID=I1DZJ2_9GAMM|nr:hypothetical protein RNAN_2476 [Rheinheimera nanhaiensis E407-8]
MDLTGCYTALFSIAIVYLQITVDKSRSNCPAFSRMRVLKER